MRGAIICIGDELISGRVAEENSRYAAARLAPLGFELAWVTMVGDTVSAIAASLELALAQTDFVLVTGGLGATDDDITAEAAGRFFGLEMAESRRMVQNLKACFAEVGREVPPGAEKMAWLPHGAQVLDRSCAGFRLTTPREQPVYFLPGVPDEMRRLLESQVLPGLIERFLPGEVVLSGKLTTFGLGESEVARRLEGLTNGYPEVGVGYYPVFPEEQVVLTVRARQRARAQEILRELEQEAGRRLQGFVVATGENTLAGVVAQRMIAQGLSLALAESCTGGLIGHRITGVSGASEFFERGLVVYSNRAKEELLGVKPATLEKHGAVSAATAAEMASGAREKAGVDLGLSVTGIAGPTGGTTEKPVGTVFFGLAAADGVRSEGLRFMGDRSQVKALAAETALDWLRRYLEDHAFLHSA
jgi:competence/damage-inducible protein CinA-like protein